MQHFVRAKGRAVLHDLVGVAVRPELCDSLRHGDKICKDPAGRGRQDKGVSFEEHLLHDPVDPGLPRRERKRIDVHFPRKLVSDSHIALVGVLHEVDRHAADHVGNAPDGRGHLRRVDHCVVSGWTDHAR